MSYQGKLLKNTAIIALGKISTQILSYILLPLYTAKMVTEEYGSYDFICTLSVFLCPIITLLIEECMFRFLIDADTDGKRKSIVTQTVIYTAIGTLVFIPISFLVMNLATNWQWNMQLMFTTFVVSNIMITLTTSLARGLSKIKLYSISSFILGIVTIIAQIIILLITPTAFGMLLANTIANIVVALFIAWRLKFRKLLGKFNKKMMKGMIKYSFPLVPNNISWLIINMSDRLLLTSMVSSAANGIYAIAAKFPNIITVFYSYFSLAWKEQAAKIVKDKDLNKHYNGIYHDTKRVMYSIMLLLIAVMPIAFPILINAQYSEAFMYMPMIMVATYFMDLSRFYGGIFEAYKNTKIMGTTTFAAAIINLIIDLALLKFIGIWAACISTLVADFAIYLYRKYKIKDYVKLRELNMIPAYIILFIILGAYYLKYIPGFNMVVYYIINGITLLFAIIYSYAINKKLINEILAKVKSKFKRKSKVAAEEATTENTEENNK